MLSMSQELKKVIAEEFLFLEELGISQEHFQIICEQILKDEVPAIGLRLLKLNLNKSINRIILINHCFTLDDLKFLNILLSVDLPIVMINLMGSNLGSMGMRYLLDGIKSHKSLKILALNNCKIQYNRDELIKAIDILKTIPNLIKVDISYNYLSDDCDNLLNIRDFQFILMSSDRGGVSNVSTSEWYISLACEKDSQDETSWYTCGHAFILLEGMRENGQLIFEKYHIVPDAKATVQPTFYGMLTTISHKATIKKGKISAFSYDRTKYHAQTFNIDNFIGEKFRRKMQIMLGTKVNFEMTTQDTIMHPKLNKFNCVTWCMYMLECIGLKVFKPMIITPVTVSSGKCLIM